MCGRVQPLKLSISTVCEDVLMKLYDGGFLALVGLVTILVLATYGVSKVLENTTEDPCPTCYEETKDAE
jgi:hypothetical protein